MFPKPKKVIGSLLAPAVLQGTEIVTDIRPEWGHGTTIGRNATLGSLDAPNHLPAGSCTWMPMPRPLYSDGRDHGWPTQRFLSREA